jgi:threonine/homoserine/homoserine lactone efflux protein
MTLHTWLAFIGASIIILLIPGPTILLVIGDSLANRGRSAWSTVAGVAAGDTTAMAVSLAGAGAQRRFGYTGGAVMVGAGTLTLGMQSA